MDEQHGPGHDTCKVLDKFNKVPRSHLGLTATVRHSGNFTGMDIADEGMLVYNVCASSVSILFIIAFKFQVVWHNQSTMKICMHSKERSMQQKKSMARGLLQ